ATAGDQALHSKARLAACVAWRLGGHTTYCLDGQVYSAGSAVSWLEELDLIKEAADLDRISSDEGEEALFVPSLAGLGAPFWAPDARGGWLGRSLATRREALVRAVVWGIAAQVASLAGAMGDDMGRPLERLRVDGGLTRSAALMQAQADLLQAPVERYPSPDATALGVGALARLGNGEAATPAEAGPDIGAGTSKANTALLHTGFDATPGTLEAKLVRRGHELLAAYALEAGIPVERTGALLVAWTEEQLAEFPAIVERAHANGCG